VHSPGVLVLQTGRRRGSAGAVVIVVFVRPRTEQRLCKHNGDGQLDGSVDGGGIVGHDAVPTGCLHYQS